MKRFIPQYTFYKNKYGSELLIDVVELKNIKKFIRKDPIHTLTYYDITLITEGSGYFTIDNQSFNAVPGDVFFSKPGEIRTWDEKRIVNGYALIFEEEFLSSFFKDSQFVQHLNYFKTGFASAPIHLSGNEYTRILQLMQSIKEEINIFHQNDTHLLRALLYEVLTLLNRSYREIETDLCKEVRNIHITRFIDYVNHSFKEQRTVCYYADKLCITPNYLNEIVNAAMGISVKQYIQNRAMDEAKRLLSYTDLSISDIAFELNYDNVSYFIRAFKQHTQLTPLAYRKEHKP